MSTPFKRGNVWQFRRAVPDDLVPIIGAVEIKQSLKTRDPDEAKARHAQAFIESERRFELARKQLAGVPCLTPEDVRQLASRWFTAETLRLDKSRGFAEWLALERTEVDHQDGSEVPLYTTLRASIEGDGEAWDPESIAKLQIESALRSAGLPLPARNSQEWSWLVSEFGERADQLSGWALARQEGRRALPGEGALPQAALSMERPSVVAAAAPAVSGKKISEAFAAYEANKLAGDDSRSVKASLEDYRAAIATFIDLCGDVNLGSITRTLVSEYRVDLPKLPANAKRMKQLSARERIERAERDGLRTIAAGTVRNRMRYLSAVLSFAVSRGWMQENPINAAGVGREVARAATKQQTAKGGRKDYTAGELAAIFTSVAFTDDTWTPPRAAFGRAWYWLPVLMYYSGARVEELAQLRASEVVRPEGIDCLSILASSDEDDGERTVKTASSRRMIPLHPDVVARGFLEYVKSQPSDGMLFPGLEPCPKGRYSTNFAKRWSVYLRDEVRLKSAASPSHGFRHAFKTLARAADIQTEVSDAITGHAGGGVGRSYGEMPLGVMADAVKRIPSISDIIEKAKASEA